MRDHLNGNGVEDYRYLADGLPYRFLHEPQLARRTKQRVADARKAAMADVLVQDQNQIGLNVYQCGTYQMHSLN